MPVISVTRELFPKATITLANVIAERDLRLAAHAISSTIDDRSDPVNYVLTTEWGDAAQSDSHATQPGASAAGASPTPAPTGGPPASRGQPSLPANNSSRGERDMARSLNPWLDQAGKFPIAHIGGIPHFNVPVLRDAPRTGVLHTTEGGWAGSLAIFKQHFAPHFMLGFDADTQKVRIVQLVQVGTIGAALKAHNNQAIVQIEMIGFSQEQPWLPDDETIEALASLMAVCLREYGIPLHHPWADGDFGKAGDNPHRSSGKYGREAGWFGHGDCPSPDTHWDPGNMKWSVALARAREIADTLGAPVSPSAGPAAMAVA